MCFLYFIWQHCRFFLSGGGEVVDFHTALPCLLAKAFTAHALPSNLNVTQNLSLWDLVNFTVWGAVQTPHPDPMAS